MPRKKIAKKKTARPAPIAEETPTPCDLPPQDLFLPEPVLDAPATLLPSYQNGWKRSMWSAVATVVCTLLVQTGALIWWAGAINNRVAQLEKQSDLIELRVRTLEGGR